MKKVKLGRTVVGEVASLEDMEIIET